MTRRIAIAVALLTGCFFSLRASLEKASATQIEMAVRRPASLSGTVSGETTSAPQTHLITQNIEDIRLGQRVVARNPLREQTQSPSVIQPATWRAVRLKMTSDGIVYDLAFLRPLPWVHSSGAEPGRLISLELHEMGLQGLAEVVSIDACPPIEDDHGSGRHIVTGTMRHPAINILNVSISGLNEPLGVTDAHPIWSETRKNFVPAGQLQAGEFLRSETGIVSQITRITPHRGPPKFTYNLEVDGQHVYHVSAAGLLVHNDCFHFANDPLASHPNAVRIRMDPNQTDWIGNLPGNPVAGQPSGWMAHHYFLPENGSLIDPAFPNGINIDNWLNILGRNNHVHIDEIGDFYRFTPDPYLLLTE